MRTNISFSHNEPLNTALRLIYFLLYFAIPLIGVLIIFTLSPQTVTMISGRDDSIWGAYLIIIVAIYSWYFFKKAPFPNDNKKAGILVGLYVINFLISSLMNHQSLTRQFLLFGTSLYTALLAIMIIAMVKWPKMSGKPSSVDTYLVIGLIVLIIFVFGFIYSVYLSTAWVFTEVIEHSSSPLQSTTLIIYFIYNSLSIFLAHYQTQKVLVPQK